ncbi:MAG: hypothetical protein H6579_04235 [Chitinophagales bacterium]|nr:hypothetical protein [Chitinophagales bacterium]
MNPILRNILAVVAGIVVGSAINMGIIMISGSLIPPPEGVNPADMESLKANMHLFQPKHFLMPFLAHALGTLAGAFVAALLAASNKLRLAMVIGIFFLAGGIANIMMLPSPLWFSILDLGLAYLPMAYLAYTFANRSKVSA